MPETYLGTVMPASTKPDAIQRRTGAESRIDIRPRIHEPADGCSHCRDDPHLGWVLLSMVRDKGFKGVVNTQELKLVR